MLAGLTRAPLVQRVHALIAGNLLFAGALAVGALIRLVTMLGYPGALWFSGDSFVYLGAALRPRPNLSKSTGYSFFLRGLLPFHSLTLVTAVQHLMGLGIAVMIYVLARRAGVSKIWSTAATLPVLLDAFEIEDEHMIMAETLFTFLIMLAMLLILWRYRTSWPVALGAGLLVGYAITVRSEGIPLLVLLPAFLVYRAVRLGWKKWRNYVAAIALALGALAPVVTYAAWFHQWNGSYGLTRSDGFYLWGRVSSFADCTVIQPPANELSICPTGSPSSRTPPGHYIWHFTPIHTIPGGPVSVANNELLRDFAIRAIEAQPLGYVRSVLSGVAKAFEWPRENYPDVGTVSFYYFSFRTQTVPDNHTWILGGTAYQDAVSYGHATPSRVNKSFARFDVKYQKYVYTWGPLLAVIVALGLGGVVRITGLGQRRPRLTFSRLNGSMLPWAIGVTLLVAPVALADFDYRYLLPVLPFVSLAAGLAFAPARVRPAAGPPGSAPSEPQSDEQPSELSGQAPGRQVPGSVS